MSMRRMPESVTTFSDKRTTPQDRRGQSQSRVLFTTVVVIAILYLAKPVCVPIALAILFAFLLTPIVTLLERTPLRRTGAIVLSLTLIVTGIGFGGWWLYQQFNDVANQFVEAATVGKIEQKLRFLKLPGGKTFALVEKTLQRVTDAGADKQEKADIKVRVIPDRTNFANKYKTLAPTIELVAAAFLVVVLVFFLLQDREQLRDKMLRLAGRAHLTVTTQAIGQTSDRISRYLLTIALLNVGFGVLVSFGLFLLKVPHAPLWGVMAGLFRFVPYVGAVLSAALPTFLSIAVFPNWYVPLAVLGLFVLTDQLIGGVFGPVLVGHPVRRPPTPP